MSSGAEVVVFDPGFGIGTLDRLETGFEVAWVQKGSDFVAPFASHRVERDPDNKCRKVELTVFYLLHYYTEDNHTLPPDYIDPTPD